MVDRFVSLALKGLISRGVPIRLIVMNCSNFEESFLVCQKLLAKYGIKVYKFKNRQISGDPLLSNEKQTVVLNDQFSNW